MIYPILEENMKRLEKKLTRIYNKCNKYGCEFTYKKVGEEFQELTDNEGQTYTAKFILVEAKGTAIINNWRFIASIEHTGAGNIINRISDEIEVPNKYYITPPICEHCQSKRSRKKTYIVMNDTTKEFQQVGKSCLNDFTNGLSAEAITQYISLFNELIKGEAPWGSGRVERHYKTETLLKYVAETIKHFGYVRTQDSGTSTATRAFEYYSVDCGLSSLHPKMKEELKKEMKEVGFNPDSLSTIKLVKEALEWISAQEDNNNYKHNLKTACSLEYITLKNLGILASLFPSYNRELEYLAEKAEREHRMKLEKAKETNSQYVGSIGDRINFKVQSAKALTSWETDWGVTVLFKILDEIGNVYIWKTSKNLPEDIKTIKGTIKEHNEFNGIKQTILTRCKVEGVN